jgi:hypothetical protein
MNSPPPFCGAEASNTLNTRQDTTISDITNSQKRASDSIHNNTLKVITKKPKRTGETDTKEYEEQIDVESVDSDVVSITEIDNNSNNDTLIQGKIYIYSKQHVSITIKNSTLKTSYPLHDIHVHSNNNKKANKEK